MTKRHENTALMIVQVVQKPPIALTEKWTPPTDPWRTPFLVFWSWMISNHSSHKHWAAFIWKSCVLLPLPYWCPAPNPAGSTYGQEETWAGLWRVKSPLCTALNPLPWQLSAFLNPSALWYREAQLSSMYWTHMALQKGQNTRDNAEKAALIQAVAGGIGKENLLQEKPVSYFHVISPHFHSLQETPA